MGEGATARLPSRARLEARLDGLVAANRSTIAVLFPAVGAVSLVASAEGLLPPALAFDPWLLLAGVLVVRLPLVAGLAPVVDRRAAAGLGALAAYAYVIEFVGVHAGIPYGEFAYGVALGPMVAGVPVALPVLFLPLVANAYLLGLLLLGGRADRAALRLPAVVGAVVATDLVLDPGAVALGFWSYGAGGAYYGVPRSNYAGWVLSATVAVGILDRAFDRDALRARLADCGFLLDDLVSFVLLWGAVCAYFGHWGAVAAAGLFGLGLLKAGRFDFDVGASAPLCGRFG